MNEFVRTRLQQVKSTNGRMLFITGAGISVDSGLPTYRGVAGLYDSQETEDGVPIEVALSGGMFSRNPGLTWKYLMQIADACKGKSFNQGHRLIADMENVVQDTWLLTQNIDGFHRDAGSRNLIEIHGTMRRMRCTECDWTCATSNYSRGAESAGEQNDLPTCPECQKLARPDVVLFDEMLPAKATQDLTRELEKGFDVIVVVGTTAVFPYISHPVHQARFHGCATVEINPGQTSLSDVVDLKLTTGATEGLWELAKALGVEVAADSETRN